MDIQIITIRAQGLSRDEGQIRSDECAVQRRSSASLLSSSSPPGTAVDAGMRYCGVPSGNPPKRVSRGDAKRAQRRARSPGSTLEWTQPGIAACARQEEEVG